MKFNEKDFIQQIKLEASSFDVPDLKESIKNEYIKQKEESSIIVSSKKSFKSIFIPSTLSALAVAGMACGIFIAINLNNNTSNPNSISNTSEPIDYSPIALNSRNEQVAYSLISSGSALATSSSSSSNSLKMAYNHNDSNNYSDEIEAINPYMLTIEGMLKSSFSIQTEMYISDLEDYTYKLVATQSLIDELKVTSTIYFNETEEQVIPPNSPHKPSYDGKKPNDPWFNDPPKKDDLEAYNIKGIFIENDNAYPFIASRINHGENDFQFTSIIYMNENDDSEYIKLEQSYETFREFDEESYTYSHYTNNRITSMVSLSFGIDNYDSDSMVFVNIFNKDNNYNSYNEYLINLEDENFVFYIDYDYEPSFYCNIIEGTPSYYHYYGKNLDKKLFRY